MGTVRIIFQKPWLPAALILGVLAAGGAFSWAAVPSGVVKGGERLRFLIWRKGDDIGRHDVRFHRDADKLVVEIEADIRVKLLLLTIYSFKQRAREEWRKGRLVRFTAQTVEDGRRYVVEGQATANGFRISGSRGTYVADAGIIPASYWHPGTANQSRLLDIKTGALLNVNIRDNGEEPIRTPAGIIRTQKYEVRGDVHITLWYDLKRRLTQAFYRAPEDGSVVEYRRGPDTADEQDDPMPTE